MTAINDVEAQVHDAWSMLNLVAYALDEIATSADMAEGGASYVIDADGMDALWGAVETIKAARANLWEAIDKI